MYHSTQPFVLCSHYKVSERGSLFVCLVIFYMAKLLNNNQTSRCAAERAAVFALLGPISYQEHNKHKLLIKYMLED